MTLELGFFLLPHNNSHKDFQIKQFLLESRPPTRYVHFPYNDGRFIYVKCIFLQMKEDYDSVHNV